MLQKFFCCALLSVGMLSIGMFAGCGSRPTLSPEIQAARKQYLLDQAPPEPVMIADARKLAAKSPMVIVGKLGVAGQSTFERGQATFAVTDAHPKVANHKHGDGQDESDCPFCKRSQGEKFAIVQFVDSEGNLLKLDAQTLLGAKEGDEVTVRGVGEVNSLDVLVINAEGVYVSKRN